MADTLERQELRSLGCEQPAKAQPPSDWKPTDEITWQQLSGAFARRYQAARGLAWTSGPHVQSLIDVADALNIQPGDRKQHAKTVLDNFFADDFAKKAGFPPGLLAKQFGRYLKPPEEDGKVDRTVQALKAQEAERRYQEAKAKAEADHARKVRERSPLTHEEAERRWNELKHKLVGE